MILEPKNITVAYRCPECGTTVFSSVGLFSLTGDMFKLKCECGGSELKITKTNDGKLRFTVPCVFCPKPHDYVISKSTVMSSDIFSIPCSYAGIDILFIGDRKSVIDAVKTSDEQLAEALGDFDLEDLKEEEEEDGEYSDEHVRDMVLFTLDELIEENDIICGCGKDGHYTVTSLPGCVEIKCDKCNCKRDITCHGGGLDAQLLFDCEYLRLLPPDEQ